MPSNRPLLLLSLPILWVFILLIHYSLQREDSLLIVFFYAIAFLSYWLVSHQTLSVKKVVILGLLIRLSLFLGLPTLSEDFIRFLWDGQLLHMGVHPFSATPNQVLNADIQISPDMELMYSQLNSPGYFTIYPPLSQLVFWLAGFGKSVISQVTIMRSIVLIFDLGVMLFLGRLKTSSNAIILYAFNPLVILELTGNLHFEGLVLFFILLSVSAIRRMSIPKTALSLAAGIGVKLTPLMFLPLLIRQFGTRNTLIGYLIIGASLFLVSIPFIDLTLITGMTESLSLFFKKFEFNAGIFFLLRQIGFWTVGYDLVHLLGPTMSCLAMLGIIWVSLKKNNQLGLEKTMVVILFIQLMMATIVHPWYIIPLFGISLLTQYRFPLIWTFLIFLTYIGYSQEGFEHPMVIMYVEYLIVGTIAWFEIVKKKEIHDIWK